MTIISIDLGTGNSCVAIMENGSPKVIENADIILEVLDARDPLNCRCKTLEAQILGMQGDKRIILILNKIDLIPQ